MVSVHGRLDPGRTIKPQMKWLEPVLLQATEPAGLMTVGQKRQNQADVLRYVFAGAHCLSSKSPGVSGLKRVFRPSYPSNSSRTPAGEHGGHMIGNAMCQRSLWAPGPPFQSSHLSEEDQA